MFNVSECHTQTDCIYMNIFVDIFIWLHFPFFLKEMSRQNIINEFYVSVLLDWVTHGPYFSTPSTEFYNRPYQYFVSD